MKESEPACKWFSENSTLNILILETQNQIAMEVMNIHKAGYLRTPNRTHPESTVSKYAEKTGIPYKEMLDYYTHPCPLNKEKEGEIAFKLLVFRIREKKISREQLLATLSGLDIFISQAEMNEFCNEFNL